MLKTRVMPCLLLRNGALIKPVKFKNPKYIGDPINTVRIYNTKEVDELIFLDITATNNNNSPPFEIIEKIASECFMPFTYGGGIRNLDDVKKLFRLGVEKIAINTYAIENPSFITQIADIYGNQSVVVSIDAKKNFWGKYRVYKNSGSKSTNLDPVEHAINMEKMGAGEILITSVDKDGTMLGFDIELIKKITGAVNIPIIACGGAGSLDDIKNAVFQGNASAVALGSMAVYQNKNRAVLVNFPKRTDLERILI